MKSSYKKLGQYIRIVDERNKDLHDLPLMGLSVKKIFFPTIANLVGTNMSTYKIVYKNQFTYIADTSRRGDKIAIALNENFDKMLVSQAYTPFEIIDKNELLPEYLMMWFRRPEFDRYARFKSHGSAREIFGWDEMCDTKLPIPSPEKQLEIVREYNVIQNRISLNNKLITKLEETAQAIYKQWFVDFEFPDENGKPYKSNGGQMEFCEELDREIPEGWEIKRLEDVASLKYGKMLDSDLFLDKGYPVYSGYGIRGYYTEYMYEYPQILVLCRGVSGTGEVRLSPKFAYITNLSIVVETNNIFSKLFLFYFLKNEDLKSLDSGSAQSMITTGDLYKHQILNPKNDVQKHFENITQTVLNALECTNKENQKLAELKELLLAKMTRIESGIETV
jgi:type I restriction enzyme S subunit